MQTFHHITKRSLLINDYELIQTRENDYITKFETRSPLRKFENIIDRKPVTMFRSVQ